MNLIWLLVAVIVGGLTSIQTAMNAELRAAVGHGVVAAAINFSVGLVCLIAVILVSRAPVPAANSISGIPVWALCGGALGATFVVSAAVLSRQLGSASFAAAIIAGQMVFALVLDHFGALGFAQNQITLGKLGAATMVVVGAILLRVL